MSNFIALSFGAELGVAAGGPGVVVSFSRQSNPETIRAVLHELAASLTPAKILVNATPMRAPGAVVAYREAIRVVTEWCEDHRVPLEAVDIDDVRENWCDDRKADAAEMVAEAHRRDYAHADVASALALAMLNFEVERVHGVPAFLPVDEWRVSTFGNRPDGPGLPRTVALALGYDLTGIALGDQGRTLSISGHIRLKQRPNVPEGRRFEKIRDRLNQLHGAGGFARLVIVDDTANRGAASICNLAAIDAIVVDWCHSNQVPLVRLADGAVKKAWTGNGNAHRDLVVDQACRRGFNPANDKEALALAALHTAFVAAA